MNQRALSLFVHLSKTLSFAKTSAACHVTPSSLSRTIQRLEEEAGVLLLERDSRRVRMTAAGESFRRFAEQTLAGWSEFKNSLQQQGGPLQGQLSIFCSVTASYSFLDEILSDFRTLHPGIEIKLHTGDSSATLDRINSESEDIGIAALPEAMPVRFSTQLLTKSPLVFIAPIQNSFGLQGTTADCVLVGSNVPLILSESGLIRERADIWFRQRLWKPNIYAQVGGHEAIVSMVALGLGVGLVPQIVLNNSPRASRVMMLNCPHTMPALAIGLCVLKRKLGNPLIAAFWNLAAQSIAKR